MVHDPQQQQQQQQQQGGIVSPISTIEEDADADNEDDDLDVMALSADESKTPEDNNSSNHTTAAQQQQAPNNNQQQHHHHHQSDWRQLFHEVTVGLEGRNPTVGWQQSVASLTAAKEYLLMHVEARQFVHAHMEKICNILLDQHNGKISAEQRRCVERSLTTSAVICAIDLANPLDHSNTLPASASASSSSNMNNNNTANINTVNTISVLCHLFNKKRAFYKGSKPYWNMSMPGAPEVRINCIVTFQNHGGFAALGQLWKPNNIDDDNHPDAATTTTTTVEDNFPPLEKLLVLLSAVEDLLKEAYGNANANTSTSSNNNNTTSTNTTNTASASPQQQEYLRSIYTDVILISNNIMTHLQSASEDALKLLFQTAESLCSVRAKLKDIYDLLSMCLSSSRTTLTLNLSTTSTTSSNTTSTMDCMTLRNDFFNFWRTLTLKLIRCSSLLLRLQGWQEVVDLIEASEHHRPPPRQYEVRHAGISFVNGIYTYSGQVTRSGYAVPNTDVKYSHTVPPECTDGAGKTITLFRCTMRSNAKWWFLSEADEDQPGTDKDVDYYQHKSKQHDEAIPPQYGWTTCRNSRDPAPTLRAMGVMVPNGHERTTLEHQLADWAMQCGVIELVLGGSVHREVVARSQPLLKFLAQRRVLQSKQLLAAWRVCTSKADAAVSSEVYALLVSLLPTLTDDLAIELLSAVQATLRQQSSQGGAGNDNNLLEVAEFCHALATADNDTTSSSNTSNNATTSSDPHNHSNNNTGNGGVSDIVRTEVLKLLWSILTHAQSDTLQHYDALKHYITAELRVEPMGTQHREVFLQTCIDVLQQSSSVSSSSNDNSDGNDDVMQLRMVQLAEFLVRCCPMDQARQLVGKDDGMLCRLLFEECCGFLRRRNAHRRADSALLTSKNTTANATSNSNINNTSKQPLQTRLNILQYIYTISSTNHKLSSERLEVLWGLCEGCAQDLELLMVFIANCSSSSSSNKGCEDGGGMDAAAQAPLVATATPVAVAPIIPPHTQHPHQQPTPIRPGSVTMTHHTHAPNTNTSTSTSTAGNNNAPLAVAAAAPMAPIVTAVALDCAMTSSTAQHAFVHLFCSPAVAGTYTPAAYRAFSSLRRDCTTNSNGGNNNNNGLDALWRIVMECRDDHVAEDGMCDLLGLYGGDGTADADNVDFVQDGEGKMSDENDPAASASASSSSSHQWPVHKMPRTDLNSSSSLKSQQQQQNTTTTTTTTKKKKKRLSSESFLQRILECLMEVPHHLTTDPSTKRAERCVRLLHNAINGNGNTANIANTNAVSSSSSASTATTMGGRSSSVLRPVAATTASSYNVRHRSNNSSTTTASSSLAPKALSIAEASRLIPHGMSSQSAYVTITLQARRPNIATANTNTSNTSTNTAPSSSLAHSQRFALHLHPSTTILQFKHQISKLCNDHPTQCIKLTSMTRPRHAQLTQLGDDVCVSGNGVVNLCVEGCEVVCVLLAASAAASAASSVTALSNNATVVGNTSNNTNASSSMDHHHHGISSLDGAQQQQQQQPVLDLSRMYASSSLSSSSTIATTTPNDDTANNNAQRLFHILLHTLEVLPNACVTHGLIWELLLLMPTNVAISDTVRRIALNTNSSNNKAAVSPSKEWHDIFATGNNKKQQQSSTSSSVAANTTNAVDTLVYTLQVCDALLQPAPEPYVQHMKVRSPNDMDPIALQLAQDSKEFRSGFIRSGGFHAVLTYFCECVKADHHHVHVNARIAGSSGIRSMTGMGYAVILRVLQCCLVGNALTNKQQDPISTATTKKLELDSIGSSLLHSMNAQATTLLLHSLTILPLLLPSSSSSASSSSSQDAMASTATKCDNTAIHTSTLTILHLLLSHPNLNLADAWATSNLADVSRQCVTRLLLWGGSARVRRQAADLVLHVSQRVVLLHWCVDALGQVHYEKTQANDAVAATTSPSTLATAAQSSSSSSSLSSSCSLQELFHVVEQLVSNEVHAVDAALLTNLATELCRKLALYPANSQHVQHQNLVCGCLKVLQAVLLRAAKLEDTVVREGVAVLVEQMSLTRWSSSIPSTSDADADVVESSSCYPYVDLAGALFDGLLLPAQQNKNTTPVCHTNATRAQCFACITTAASLSSSGGNNSSNVGYQAIVQRVLSIFHTAAPTLADKWGSAHLLSEGGTSNSSASAAAAAAKMIKYSGLRNQGCTCYMNSLLQQLFMMPKLREKLCRAPLPVSLRGGSSSVVSTAAMSNNTSNHDSSSSPPASEDDKGAGLIGKRIRLQWESGASFEAMVEEYEAVSNMHTIRYVPMSLPNSSSSSDGAEDHKNDMAGSGGDVSVLPDLSETFVLSEGRPNRETGAFEILDASVPAAASATNSATPAASITLPESEDQMAARKLLHELQRTFVYLDNQQGRCFDPRQLVEASTCLKLEFDVWQQNDASEYATKLFDRLEVPLKQWCPEYAEHLVNTFGIKQTKQKICKECGLKTNREETLMNIDLQIKNKSNIHESLSTFCEVDLMYGDNQVNCDRCKEKRDTVLRTAISHLPNVLILSLKRFDLDFDTFTTVKLNSRCAFGETLNMKQYTLAGIEAMEKEQQASMQDTSGDVSMDDACDAENDADALLPDEEYEYKLAGVIIHAGVAQGGHYYSYIKDRTRQSGASSGDATGEGKTDDSNAANEDVKWYRFDDEDVTPFDPSSIESECFGGKVKKETKWPNGQVTTTETEQFANALMLFYEKVTPAVTPKSAADKEKKDAADNSNHNDDAMDTEESTNTTTKEGEEEEKGEPALDLSTVEMVSGYEAFMPDVDKTNATHSWHAFLLDAEFQLFVKKLLTLCSNAPSSSSSSNNASSSSSSGDGDAMDIVSSPGSTMSTSKPMTPVTSAVTTPTIATHSSTWQSSIFHMATHYYFDILLHTHSGTQTDARTLHDWTHALQLTLHTQPVYAYWLLRHSLGFVVSDDNVTVTTHMMDDQGMPRTGNWWRVYYLECPEYHARVCAHKVLYSALVCAISHVLGNSDAYSEELAELERFASNCAQHYSLISNDFDDDDDPEEEQSKATTLQFNLNEVKTKSIIGTALQTICSLLDMAPRRWPFSSELCTLLSNMTRYKYKSATSAATVSVNSLSSSSPKSHVRQVLSALQMPARIVALMIRECAPSMLQRTFPALCLSSEHAETLSRGICTCLSAASSNNHDAMNVSNALPLLSGNSNQNTSPTVNVNVNHHHGNNLGGHHGSECLFSHSPADYLHLLEALCGLWNIPGHEAAALVYYSATNIDNNSASSSSSSSSSALNNGKIPPKLTPECKAALTVIFQEFTSPTSSRFASSSSSSTSTSATRGMSQSDIAKYLERCGMENVPPQKISSILNKYPTVPSSSSATNGMNVNGSTVNVGTVNMSTAKGKRLSLEGFLMYYRDTAGTNDAQVRSDLHTFGFRRDLTRRPEHIRLKTVTPLQPNSGNSNNSEEANNNDQQQQQRPRDNLESIALDVHSNSAQSSKQRSVDLNALTTSALNSYGLYSIAYNTCESLAAYLLATVAIMNCNQGGEECTCNSVIIEALCALSRAPTNWAGSETLSTCLMIFKVLLGIPDQYQQQRIALVMEASYETTSSNKPDKKNVQVGLLVASKELSTRGSSSSSSGSAGSNNNSRFAVSSEYRSADAVDRYIGILIELYSQNAAVKKWMDERQASWAWIQRWRQRSNLNNVVHSHHHGGGSAYAQGNYTGRHHSSSSNHHRGGQVRHGHGHAPHMNTTGTSDNSASDVGFVQDCDSDEEDDDVLYNHGHGHPNNRNPPVHSVRHSTAHPHVMNNSHSPYEYSYPRHVFVRRAGVDSINGCYTQSDSAFDNIASYEKEGFWNDKTVMFSLYRWNMTEDGKSWFISIIPPGKSPGSKMDIDFYCCKSRDDIPPSKGWREMKDHGLLPAPIISFNQTNISQNNHVSDNEHDGLDVDIDQISGQSASCSQSNSDSQDDEADADDDDCNDNLEREWSSGIGVEEDEEADIEEDHEHEDNVHVDSVQPSSSRRPHMHHPQRRWHRGNGA
eukprot:CAMPEP_0196807370 /NCGR_PEP_ID=MMETSP1362-20130617/7352_1 /TAXON_ID=163516 /ORGANISM="Leptocylindrus danicus, Strain CCMP1856" /LENGTH=3994 /DNA_ID=CAMNT_0042181271 /DNA_START=105 /DNA_END=12089 /DNA_ORIENTATION=-